MTGGDGREVTGCAGEASLDDESALSLNSDSLKSASSDRTR